MEPGDDAIAVWGYTWPDEGSFTGEAWLHAGGCRWGAGHEPDAVLEQQRWREARAPRAANT